MGMMPTMTVAVATQAVSPRLSARRTGCERSLEPTTVDRTAATTQRATHR